MTYVPRLTHPQRRERRRAMAEAVRGGKTLAQVAADFGVTGETVGVAVKEFQVDRPPLENLADRIRRLDHRAMSLKEIADLLVASEAWVGETCRQAGIEFRRLPRGGRTGPHPKWLAVDLSRPDKKIAEEMGVSRQRVSQIRKRRAMQTAGALP